MYLFISKVIPYSRLSGQYKKILEVMDSQSRYKISPEEA